MRHEAIRVLKDEEFRRLTGLKRKTFEARVPLLRAAKAQQKRRGGKPNGLIIRGQTFDDAGLLAGIPHVFSQRADLRQKRKSGPTVCKDSADLPPIF